MDEKAKRKEKPKNQPRNPVFVMVVLILFLIFAMSAGMVFYFSVMPDPAQIAFEQTTTMIAQANSIAMTMIAASETRAVADVTATAANATTRAELRLTATVHLRQTEASQSTIDADARQTELYGTATAAYLIPIMSQTAFLEGLTATAEQGSILTETANAPIMTPSPTAGNCGYAIYSGTVESPHASAEWREALDMASVEYRSARLLYDAFEAMNDCQGNFIPLPYQCEIMEIAIDISQDDWVSLSERYLLLTPILTSIDVENICNTPEARLRVYFYLSESQFYLWEAERQIALETWQNGVDAASFWAYGRWRDSGQ